MSRAVKQRKHSRFDARLPLVQDELLNFPTACSRKRESDQRSPSLFVGTVRAAVGFATRFHPPSHLRLLTRHRLRNKVEADNDVAFPQSALSCGTIVFEAIAPSVDTVLLANIFR